MTIERHDLLDVAPEAWDAAVADLTLPTDAMALVAGWCRRGWPVIVRRRLAGEMGHRGKAMVPVALQLPNAVGRLRVTLDVPADAVARRPRLDLAEAAVSAPLAWGETIEALLALGERFGTAMVYGGLLWQHVTGQAVLRPGSDLDLVWRPTERDRLALMTALTQLDGGPVRVDGEIVLPDGGGVAWRELYAAAVTGAGEVAVKTMDRVTLRLVADIVPQIAALEQRVPLSLVAEA